MVARLPGDRFSEEECIVIAKELDEYMPSSNICRYCGEVIKTMCFTQTGSCCEVHDKLRHDPDAFRKQPEFAEHFALPPREILPSTDGVSEDSK